MNLQVWAQRHNVSQLALSELGAMLAEQPAPATNPTPKSEAACQQEIRLAAPRYGGVMWRNNVGVFNDADGVPIRFGLANDSGRLNKRIKSADLIGYLPFRIGTEHVGKIVAVFMAIECKRGDWKWTGSAREVAQRRFLQLIESGGGCAGFARSATDLSEIITKFEGQLGCQS